MSDPVDETIDMDVPFDEVTIRGGPGSRIQFRADARNINFQNPPRPAATRPPYGASIQGVRIMTYVKIAAWSLFLVFVAIVLAKWVFGGAPLISFGDPTERRVVVEYKGPASGAACRSRG